jgi:hypothetical protein
MCIIIGVLCHYLEDIIKSYQKKIATNGPILFMKWLLSFGIWKTLKDKIKDLEDKLKAKKLMELATVSSQSKNYNSTSAYLR